MMSATFLALELICTIVEWSPLVLHTRGGCKSGYRVLYSSTKVEKKLILKHFFKHFFKHFSKSG